MNRPIVRLFGLVIVMFAVLIAFLYGTLGSQGWRIQGGLRSTLAWFTYSILGCLTKVIGSS